MASINPSNSLFLVFSRCHFISNPDGLGYLQFYFQYKLLWQNIHYGWIFTHCIIYYNWIFCVINLHFKWTFSE